MGVPPVNLTNSLAHDGGIRTVGRWSPNRSYPKLRPAVLGADHYSLFRGNRKFIIRRQLKLQDVHAEFLPCRCYLIEHERFVEKHTLSHCVVLLKEKIVRMDGQRVLIRGAAIARRGCGFCT